MKSSTPYSKGSTQELTLNEAQLLLKGSILHDNVLTNKDGTCQRWRVAGEVKVVESPVSGKIMQVEIPVRRGMYQSGFVTAGWVYQFHLPVNCEREK